MSNIILGMVIMYLLIGVLFTGYLFYKWFIDWRVEFSYNIFSIIIGLFVGIFLWLFVAIENRELIADYFM